MTHGSRTAYVRGCRCEDCRGANRDYARMRERRRSHPDVWGQPTDLVGALKARHAVDRLQAMGFGMRRISELTGISRHSLHEIARGITRRTRPSTVEALEALCASDLAWGQLVDAAPTWARIDALRAAGYTKTALAGMLGRGAALQIRPDRVRRSTERDVRELYERLWWSDPRVRATGDLS